MQSIYQLVAGFRSGDAISNAALLMRDVFRGWGCRSEILVQRSSVTPDLRDDTLPLEAAEKLGPDDIVILHLSIGHRINLLFPELKCKKVIVYHNITPAKYFSLLNQSIAKDLEEGRRHLKRLVGVADLNLADSNYNASELVEAGYGDVKVFPLPINIDSLLHTEKDPDTLVKLDDGSPNILFVGRIAPNKKLDDLLKVMFYLTKIEPRARLVHIGSEAGTEMYFSMLQAQVNALGLKKASVRFMCGVPQHVLNTCYATADVFLCMSEHEGFCAPLIEAMLHQVPVLSLASAAIPETLGGAGVLFSAPPDYLLIAETVAEVLRNQTLRSQIIARQNKRLDAFRNRDLSADMRALFAPLLIGS
jgi:glycosyltransferase involved in cell wall biosynthesis